jgi:lipoate-protein ligase A
MRENHEKLAHHRTKKMCKTFECASHESKVHLLKQISDDPESVSEVIGRTPHVPPDMKEALRDRVDASMSARMDDIKREEMTPECISKDIMNAISKLDDQKQQEIVTEMLENMSEAGRLTLMSTMG